MKFTVREYPKGCFMIKMYRSRMDDWSGSKFTYLNKKINNEYISKFTSLDAAKNAIEEFKINEAKKLVDRIVYEE